MSKSTAPKSGTRAKSASRADAAKAEKTSIERGKQAVKAVFRRMEATSQKFTGSDTPESTPPAVYDDHSPAPPPLAPSTEGVVSPAALVAGPEAGAMPQSEAEESPPTALQHDEPEIDLTPYREVVGTVAGFLWRLRGGEDIANWVAAERIVRAALREAGR